MKVEYTDVSDTAKTLNVEIPSDIVGGEIDRVVRDYARSLRLPGFRPGKIPPKIIRQRFKAQILHDVAHDLIPRAVDDALRERGVEPIATPNIRDVNVDENQPLTFTASFDTLPPFEPGDLPGISLHRATPRVDEEAVNLALQRLRDRAARYEPVEGRGATDGDTVVVDLERTDPGGAAE